MGARRMGRLVYMFWQDRELLLAPEQNRFGEACAILQAVQYHWQQETRGRKVVDEGN